MPADWIEGYHYPREDGEEDRRRVRDLERAVRNMKAAWRRERNEREAAQDAARRSAAEGGHAVRQQQE